jgi:hypothetical protein
MPNLDDERFEIYLKRFRPLALAALPTHSVAKLRRRITIVASLLATAAVLIPAVVMLHTRGNGVSPVSGRTNPSLAVRPAPWQPLTLGGANQLLVRSPSFAAALDSLEAEPEVSAISKGKESALAILSQENLNP